MYWNGCFSTWFFLAWLWRSTPSWFNLHSHKKERNGWTVKSKREIERDPSHIYTPNTIKMCGVCAVLTNICEWHKLAKCKFSKAWTWTSMLFGLVISFEELFPCFVCMCRWAEGKYQNIAQLIHTHCEEINEYSHSQHQMCVTWNRYIQHNHHQ